MSAIIRAGVHADGRALVYCGGGCGETMRQGEHEILARENLGMGAPVCPWCRTAGTLEHLAAAALGDKFRQVKFYGSQLEYPRLVCEPIDHEAVREFVRKEVERMVKELERRNYP